MGIGGAADPTRAGHTPAFWDDASALRRPGDSGDCGVGRGRGGDRYPFRKRPTLVAGTAGRGPPNMRVKHSFRKPARLRTASLAKSSLLIEGTTETLL